ncbi:MAG: type ISP restriction/modification enzyme [Pseudomonadota bacterium]
MSNKAIIKFKNILENYAEKATSIFKLPVSFNPEDQLKSLAADIFKQGGELLDFNVNVVTEVTPEGLHGRPDMGVTVNALLAGHVELKAPGKGAEPKKFNEADKKQWEKFKYLPNVIYTDGNEWALYRNGDRVGKLIRFSGDVFVDGKAAVDEKNAQALYAVINDFLRWEPIVPSTPRALAEMLAPICRLLRLDVLAALQDNNSNLSTLAVDWRQYLFPNADDKQFADAYAETLTYALLLARLSGERHISVPNAVQTIKKGHALLSEALKILGDEAARKEISISAGLMERVIGAVDVAALTKRGKEDPWLYFYEDFLAVYDPQMRKSRGVYYTPVPVVQAQVRLVAQLLEERFNAEFSYVDPRVIMLDPAAGTGTYILAAAKYAIDKIADARGEGMRKQAATAAANNLHAFEILVGPYAVAHLRLTQQIFAEGGTPPKDGVHVYLTDTLESPEAAPPGHLPLALKQLGEEHLRAQEVKAKTPVFVCMGNPPYDRQLIGIEDQEIVHRKGGWVRYGGGHKNDRPILQDFIDPLKKLGLGAHAKNLYNDYVYFWRWALWKVFESKKGPGVVSFITASSYLRGPGFSGMRRVMRETFDELWIIDLEGDNLGARKTENVFAIQTPVAIAIGVRFGEPSPDKIAKAHYTKIEGTQKEKFDTLSGIAKFDDLEWSDCLSGWAEPILPRSDKDYWRWPLLTDVFPWQECGMQFKRSWPIAESKAVLEKRWKALLKSDDKILLFKETRDRKINKEYPSLTHSGVKLTAISKLTQDKVFPDIVRLGYRSFDRQWAILDNRVGDYLRPTLWRSYGNQQVFLTSLLTDVLGEGPGAVVVAYMPDMHHFCNRGARDIIPLWKDADESRPNITQGILEALKKHYGKRIKAEELFAYCYALLATPRYVETFWDELSIPGPRIPITKDAKLFTEAVDLGRRLIWLHTFGERFVPKGKKRGQVPQGTARCKVGTPATQEEYPDSYSYDEAAHELRVGKGVFERVRPEAWHFSVSGLQVVKSWLNYRMRKRAGKKSSLLDEIRPERWEFDGELLDLLWVLDATVNHYPDMERIFKVVLKSALFHEGDFPKPIEAERSNAPAAVRFQAAVRDYMHKAGDDN